MIVNLDCLGKTGSIWPVFFDAIFAEAIINPHFKPDVLRMHFDRIDENYVIIKSNLHFKNIIKTGLIGLSKTMRLVSLTHLYFSHQQKVTWFKKSSKIDYKKGMASSVCINTGCSFCVP